MTHQEQTLPSPDRFRTWLRHALQVVAVPASTISIRAGLSVNTVGRILKDGDVTLGTASKLEATLRKEAGDRQASLPDLVEVTA